MPYFDGLYYRVAPLPCFEKQQILAPHTIGEVMFVCDFHTISTSEGLGDIGERSDGFDDFGIAEAWHESMDLRA
jgi:hypothetical protein